MSAAATPAPPSLEDKVRILQKYGGRLTDEQITEYLELEERRARNVIENEKRAERVAADQKRIAAEIRQIARDNIGKRIILSINRERVNSLNADGSVPCPACGEDFHTATGALLEMADLLRSHPDPYALIGRMYIGAKPSGIPCIYTAGTCSHCGAGASILVQLVI